MKWWVDQYKQIERPYVNPERQRRTLDQLDPEDDTLCFGLDGIVYKWFPQGGGGRESKLDWRCATGGCQCR